MRRVIMVAGLIAALATASDAAAQTAPRPRGLTLAGGMVWSGEYSVGDRTADIRQNAMGSTPPPFTLFRAAASLGSVVGVEGRIGVALTRSIAVEGGFAWSRPHLDVTISDDVEGANASFDGETTSRYVVEASLIWTLPIVSQDARLRPYVLGGGGYLRQLHEGHTLVETGQIYHVGGGARYFLRGWDGRLRPIGVRGDVRAYIRKDGIEFEDKIRTYPALSALVFVGF